VDLVFLPATEPGDHAFGQMPTCADGSGNVRVHRISFQHMVWYNETVREEAISQILALNLPKCVLAGFSKSGLGAWNITRMIPDRVAATVIFDAPVVRKELPPWGTEPYYRDNEAWVADQPACTVDNYAARVPSAHRLVLIGGEIFHGEMRQLSARLWVAGISHMHLHRPQLAHHWRSGWLEEGLAALGEAGLWSS